MVKRNSKNIGKMVRVVIKPENQPFAWGKLLNGRLGKIVGFRGDCGPKDPYVCVFLYDLGKTTGSVIPIAGHLLEYTKKQETGEKLK